MPLSEIRTADLLGISDLLTAAADYSERHCITFPKCFCKLSSQTKSFSVINVNAILTLQLPPHAVQIVQHEAGAAESKSNSR